MTKDINKRKSEALQFSKIMVFPVVRYTISYIQGDGKRREEKGRGEEGRIGRRGRGEGEAVGKWEVWGGGKVGCVGWVKVYILRSIASDALSMEPSRAPYYGNFCYV